MQRSDGGELGRSKSNTAKLNFSLHESASDAVEPKADVAERDRDVRFEGVERASTLIGGMSANDPKRT